MDAWVWRFVAVGLAFWAGLFPVCAQEEGGEDSSEALVSSFLDRFDADSDGAISKSELPERGQEAFAAFDADGDGLLKDDELKRAAEAWNRVRAGPNAPKEGSSEEEQGRTETPESEGKADEATGLWFQNALRYHVKTKGEALLILKDGKTVFESYDNGYQDDRAHYLASGTKSFSGVAAACAVEDGLLTWDELACETITEWKEDKLKSQITVRHLLSLSSGLDPATDALQGPNVEDRYAYALNVPVKHKPGTRFEYGPCHYYVFAELLKRKLAETDENLKTYFLRRVADPIGMEIDWWPSDKAGNPNAPSGVRMHASEWAKFGELVRMGGRWGDKQIVAQEHLDECFKASRAKAAYGLTWWLDGTDDTGDGGKGLRRSARNSWMPADYVAAKGKGKQRLIVVRSLGLVVVRFADDTQSFNDTEFMAQLLYGMPASKVKASRE